MNRLIINADDFGLTKSCTEAIFKAMSEGIITDTTMVANGEAFELGVKLSKEPVMAEKIGIHFNLTEGRPLTDEMSSCGRIVCDGKFLGRAANIKKLVLNSKEKIAIEKELRTQAKRISDSDIKIVHADSHHHVHNGPFIGRIVFKICDEFTIRKIRIHRNLGNINNLKRMLKNILSKKIRQRGFATTDFFGGGEDYCNIQIREKDTVYELMVHPDFDKDGNLIDRTEIVEGNPVGPKLEEVCKTAWEKIDGKLSKYSYSEL